MKVALEESPIDKLKRNVVCPVELSLRVFGGKWRGSILYQLNKGPVRFNELKLMVQDAVVYYHQDEDQLLSSKVLTEHLTALLDFGLIQKCSKDELGDTYNLYSLTEKGESAMPILIDLFYWGENHF